jgi:hypothetical protein
MIWRIYLLFLGLMLFPPRLEAASFVNPRLAVVISRTSFKRDWQLTQMSGQGWVGIANLAGIPYGTLFLEEITSGDSLAPFSLLVLAQCSAVEPDTARKLLPILENYLARGGHLIIDGPLAAFDQEGRPGTADELWLKLGLSPGGRQGDATFRIQVARNNHAITRPFEVSQYLSQMLAKPLEVLQFSEGGEVLLTSTNGRDHLPFLSCREAGKNRLVLLSDATTFAGATSIFRNEPPNGFFANRVLDALVRATQWALYGNLHGPFPAPQFSNAPLSAIVRLDADLTKNLDYQKQTFEFLYRVARESGVVPLYCWVSSEGKNAGWRELAALGRQLEELGGEIGTHSKFHRITSGMGAEQYKEELDGSIAEIESNMQANGAGTGKIDLFINPGDTIINSDYEELARRFHLAMTHGFEQDTPIGYGVITWFTGKFKELVVLNDSPSPDYQWFYDPTWSYTTAQVTNHQEATFDHMFQDIGRGVIYNQMWHDYGISSMPLRNPYRSQEEAEKKGPGRIANPSNLAMYEALKSKFSTLPIYCPEPMEAVEKLRTMAFWDYSWDSTETGLEITLDLSKINRPGILENIGGMGLRIENSAGRLQSVLINGQPHDAFSDQVIILPNLPPGKTRIRAALSPVASSNPHVTYVSKRLPFVRRSGNGLEFQLQAKSKARFALVSATAGVVLHADGQEYNRRGDGQLSGFVTSGRTLRFQPLSTPGLALTYATVPIAECVSSPGSLSLKLETGSQSERQIHFALKQKPLEARLNGVLLVPVFSSGECRLNLPLYQAPATLVVRW